MIARPIPPAASGGSYIPPEDTFEVLTAEPAVRFVTQAAQPPSNLYVSKGEAIQLNAASSQANESITVTYRFLLAGGGIHAGQFVMQVSSNRAVNTHAEQLPEGYLLSVACQAAVATTRGQTFARLFVTKTAIGVGVPSYVLMSDYVTNQITAGFPNGRVQSSVEGPGNITLVQNSAPAAGFDWLIQVPTNTRWLVKSLRATLVTSVAVANRLVLLEVFQNSFDVGNSISNFTEPASNTTAYSWGSGIGINPAAVGEVNISLPVGLLIGGPGVCSLRSLTVNLQAADAWSNQNVLVEEWLDNV